jgi:alkylhydroperoxidase/carboxymuconolactone decarboxylase family protein YurZ
MTGDEERERLKQRFIEVRGYWSEAWDELIAYDPDYFAAYLDLSTPRPSGRLDARTRELICIAIDVATTHLYRPGARIHIRRALELGVSPEEIVEVFEVASLIGVHAVTEGVLLLRKELDAARPEARSDEPPTSPPDSP